MGLLEGGGALLEQPGDLQMLRAGVLALAALHAVGGFSASAGGEGIFSFGLFQRQIIQDLVVACTEDPRDGDLLRAALGAVAAAGAGDGTPVVFCKFGVKYLINQSCSASCHTESVCARARAGGSWKEARADLS